MGQFKQYPPYPLPRVSFTNVRLFNSISLRGTLWEFPFGTGRARLALQHAGPDFSSECTVRVMVNNAPWELLFSSQEFFRLHPILQAEGADPLSIPAELKTAMIETMVSPVLQSLQQALGVEIKITSVRLSAPQRRELSEELGSVLFSAEFLSAAGESAGTLLVCAVSLNGQGTSDMFNTLSRLPRATGGVLAAAASEIPITFTVCAGECTLLAEEFSSLAMGDVILVNDWKPEQNQAQLCFYCENHRMMGAPCKLENGNAVLLEAPQFLSDSAMESTKATDIVLSFDLEKRTIAVKDLESLAPGYTFSLSSQTRAPVTIRANGKPIALGRLVDINGKLGVELVEAL